MAFINEGARRSLAALASATSAQDTARNGTALTTNQIHPGSLVAKVAVTIVTGSVVATFKWQVSDDNSTFYDLKLPNNAAEVTITATATRAIPAPDGVGSWKYVRPVITLSGAPTAAGDLTAVDCKFLQFNDLE
jgi:hypothetical protein